MWWPWGGVQRVRATTARPHKLLEPVSDVTVTWWRKSYHLPVGMTSRPPWIEVWICLYERCQLTGILFFLTVRVLHYAFMSGEIYPPRTAAASAVFIAMPTSWVMGQCVQPYERYFVLPSCRQDEISLSRITLSSAGGRSALLFFLLPNEISL
jgi:hypothetical protein